MKKNYTLVLSAIFACTQFASAQQFTQAFKNAQPQDRAGEVSEAITFITMESVRHGLSGNLKGVGVQVIQGTAEEQPAIVALSNAIGEPWKYEVFSSAGKICFQGDVGYQRNIVLAEQGAYLFKFSHKNGLVAFDEINIRKQANSNTPLAESKETDKSAPLPPAVAESGIEE